MIIVPKLYFSMRNLWENYISIYRNFGSVIPHMDSKVKDEFDQTERKLLRNPETDIVEMFVKSSGRLKLCWVLNIGHFVPVDAPDAVVRMLKNVK